VTECETNLLLIGWKVTDVKRVLQLIKQQFISVVLERLVSAISHLTAAAAAAAQSLHHQQHLSHARIIKSYVYCNQWRSQALKSGWARSHTPQSPLQAEGCGPTGLAVQFSGESALEVCNTWYALYKSTFLPFFLFWAQYVSLVFSSSSALCDILYKRLRNTLTYLLTYLEVTSVVTSCQCHGCISPAYTAVKCQRMFDVRGKARSHTPLSAFRASALATKGP